MKARLNLSAPLLLPCLLAAAIRPGRAEPFRPDDPLFFPDPDGRHGGQWHLREANFPAAWESGATGRGVIIGIVDSAFGLPHPEVEGRRVRALERDFRDGDDDPGGPVEPDGCHGLMVAGIAAAEGGNGAGICGAAPGARMAWLRAGAPFMLEEMIRHDPDPERPVKVKNWSIGTGEPFSRSTGQTVARQAFRETAERGMIHVLAAGNNGRGAGGDCAKSPLCGSPHVLVIAACDRARRGVPWSGYGGAVTACAPTAEPGASPGGILTAADGETLPPPFAKDYTASFGGTSAAAPQVAGLMALGAEVLPALDSRLAKHLLARTCARPAEEAPGRWENAAGVSHDPRTGFGVIDAGRFVEAARRGPEVTPLRLEPDSARDSELGMERVKVEEDAPDGDPRGISRAFRVKGGTPLEEVEIFLEVRHRGRGELSAMLESPSGTKRELFSAHPQDRGEDIIWIFVTHAFWGEEPGGVWRITLIDSAAGETGRWKSFAWRMRMGQMRSTGRE